MTVKKDQKVAGVTAVKASGASLSGNFALGQVVTASYPAGVIGTLQFTRSLVAYPYTKTPIDGALANAVNSLKYTISKADQGYTIGVDCSSQVSTVTGSAIPSAVANLMGGDKLVANDGAPTGQSGLRYANFKREAEAPYSGVRVGILYKASAGTNPVYEGYVGSSDTNLTTSQAVIFSPMTNGVAQNNIVTGAAADGWRRVTWNGGADSITAPLLAGSGQKIAGFLFSDIIPLNSKPRIDTPGARPMAVAKVSQTAAGAAYVGGSGHAAWRTAVGQPFFREELSSSSASALPTAYPTGAVNLNSDDSIAIWLDYQFTVPVRSFLVTGDSRSSSAAALYGNDSWWRRAIKTKSTAALPCVAVNAAGSGHSQSEYLAIATAMINAGWKGTDVIVPGFSQNGFTGDAAFIAANRVFLDLCISKGYNIYMTTDYGVPGYTPGQGQEDGRQRCIAEAKRLAAIGQVTLVDTDAMLTDYTTDPTKPWLKPQYNTNVVSGVEGIAGSGDGTHAGPSGQAVMAQVLLAVL